MPFPFLLPTTSYLPFSDFYSSSTHPSLPLTTTSTRAVLRDALKKQKRLPPAQQAAHLNTVFSALNEYIPYLFALDAGLSSQPVAGEEIDIILLKELEVEWRCTLSSTRPGLKPPRQKLRGLETEIFFTLSTLAYTHCLLSRTLLRPLYQNDATPPPLEERTKAIAESMQHLLSAHSIHAYLLKRHSQSPTLTSSTPVDISPPILSALSSLALASATLITVLKDDPYAVAVSETRNTQSKDWMFKAPSIPPVRSHLFARLCLAAAEHAGRALSALRNTRGVEEDLVRFAEDLRGAARGKAARFLAIDAEGRGKVGEGIAWLRGAKRELGLGGEDGRSGGKVLVKGFEKIKRDWKERREDRRIQKGGADWGADAGRLEEGRVVEMLEKKWVKMNDTVSFEGKSLDAGFTNVYRLTCRLSRHSSR